MRAWVLLLSPLVLTVLVCAARVVGSQTPPAPVTQSDVVVLPISDIVLYSNGLGQFRRSGEVEGKPRIELSASSAEMNDLLKSLTVEGAETAAVIYDSPAAIEQALPTYAIDLSTNPTLGELLQLARGETVEVTLTTGAGEITGSILGMEERMEKTDAKLEVLNLWTDAGARSLPLAQVRAVRFVNAKLDADVRRALSLLASQRNAGRKTLRLALSGEGRRRVGVSYVAEAPVWKASYRLVSGAEGATRLQGWALVENTTAEDWQDVKVTLAGGRPVSFQMDLYPPLFVPRPIVEPEQFAALRPPSYAGPASNFLGGAQGMQGGALGVGGLGVGGMAGGGLNLGGAPGQQFLGGANGFSGGNNFARGNRYQILANANLLQDEDEAPTYEKYKNRILEQRGGKTGDDSPLRVVAEVSDAPIGEPARYALPQQLSIPRLKSALVPFLNQSVTATPVSVYSPDIHATRALQAYRIKNSTGQPWVAGPISVVRADGYAGDARLAEWPADEERLVAFALDSGCECQRTVKDEPIEIVGVKIDHGRLEETRRHRVLAKYSFKHHAGPDRVLWVEHPAEPGWMVVPPAKAEERTKDRFRFKVELPAGKTASLEVALDRKTSAHSDIASIDDSVLRKLGAMPVAPDAVKQAIAELLTVRDRLNQASARLTEARAAFKEANEEQARLRTNLERVPNGSDVQKELLDKLSRHEAEIEAARKKTTAAATEVKTINEELQTKTAALSAG